MNLVNADRCADRNVCSRGVFGVLLEHTTNCSFIDPNIIGHAGKGVSERFLRQVEHQALGHGVDFIHIVERLKERSLASATQVAESLNQNAGGLASDRNVHEQLLFDFMPVQMGAATMRAAQNNLRRLGGELVPVCALFYAQNAPVFPSQNVHGLSPMVQIVEKAFFPLVINPVKEGKEGERLLCHPTRYADLWTAYIAELSHAICRIAQKVSIQTSLQHFEKSYASNRQVSLKFFCARTSAQRPNQTVPTALKLPSGSEN